MHRAAKASKELSPLSFPRGQKEGGREGERTGGNKNNLGKRSKRRQGSRGAAGALEENRIFECVPARDKSTGSFKKQRKAAFF